jgi:hypothetical protein
MGGIAITRVRILSALVAVLLLTACDTQLTPSSEPTSMADATELYAVCMQDAGWQTEITGGSTSTVIPRGQEDVYYADSAACVESTQPEIDLDPMQWQQIYDLMVESAACLQRLGYTTEVPTWQSYRDGGYAWSPHIALAKSGAIGPEQMAIVEIECPQVSAYDLP